MIVEAANGPTTPAATPSWRERGIYVVPDILANAGGVVVSYFEWVQDLQSFFWEESEVNQRLQRIMVQRLQRGHAWRRSASCACAMPPTSSPCSASSRPSSMRGIYP